jgi:hypothetical protein
VQRDEEEDNADANQTRRSHGPKEDTKNNEDLNGTHPEEMKFFQHCIEPVYVIREEIDDLPNGYITLRLLTQAQALQSQNRFY